jgi:hypothetical protein
MPLEMRNIFRREENVQTLSHNSCDADMYVIIFKSKFPCFPLSSNLNMTDTYQGESLLSACYTDTNAAAVIT